MCHPTSEKIQRICKHQVNLSYIKESDSHNNCYGKVERKEKDGDCDLEVKRNENSSMKLPEESAPILHLNAQGPGHHNHGEVAQQVLFVAATLILHYLRIDQISLEPH